MKTRNPWLVLLWTFGLLILLTLPEMIWMGWGMAEFPIPGGEDGQKSPAWIFSAALLTLLVGAAVIFLTVKYLWRRSGTWMGVTLRPRQFLFAALAGILAPLPPFLILMLLGVAEIESGLLATMPRAALPVLGGYLLFFLYAAASEELVFRGMAAREIALRWGWPLAWLISGIYFGLVHLQGGLSPWETSWLVFSALFVSGLFIALYRRGASLWLPTAFHMGWNFCLTNILGTQMSGVETQVGLGTAKLEGPFLLTGGKFGLEISLVTLLFYGIYTLLVLRLRWGMTMALLPNHPPDEGGSCPIRATNQDTVFSRIPDKSHG